MSSTISAIKTLVVPAVIALLVFLVLTYLVFPFWQRYRSRYSQYLPLETISTQTSSLRQRIQTTIARFVVPSAWRQRMHDRIVVGVEEHDYNSEEGEELSMVGDDQDLDLVMDGRHGIDSTTRLSRDLEQGFMDDSDDETMPPR